MGINFAALYNLGGAYPISVCISLYRHCCGSQLRSRDSPVSPPISPPYALFTPPPSPSLAPLPRLLGLFSTLPLFSTRTTPGSFLYPSSLTCTGPPSSSTRSLPATSTSPNAASRRSASRGSAPPRCEHARRRAYRSGHTPRRPSPSPSYQTRPSSGGPTGWYARAHPSVCLGDPAEKGRRCSCLTPCTHSGAIPTGCCE